MKKCSICGAMCLNLVYGELCPKCAYGDSVSFLPSRWKEIKKARIRLTGKGETPKVGSLFRNMWPSYVSQYEKH
jgi:hypothetical protein